MEDVRNSKGEIDIILVPNEYRYLVSDEGDHSNAKMGAGCTTNDAKQVACRSGSKRVIRPKLLRTRSSLDTDMNRDRDIEFSHSASIAQVLHQRRLLETNVTKLHECIRAHHENCLDSRRQNVEPSTTR
ncbi:hypothetical protein M8J75_000980 [Diaphorina citri]|nr:hypothetical protein M8J75_000980 [Diaphorina citri]